VPFLTRRLASSLPLAAVLSALLALSACATPSYPSRAVTGLFTSLPILWRESDRIADLLQSDQRPHWALPVLARGGAVHPLDRLAGASGKAALAGIGVLVMAQPRPLAPDENLALDAWVRRGGRLLLFADPMLTSESAFPLGDPRRQQDIALLSPILSRWGLQLHFDEDQALGDRIVTAFGAAFPVNLGGSLEITRGGGNCRIEPGKLAALCTIGRGRVLIVADAALLEAGSPDDSALRVQALARLLEVLG